jgi:hypothetical protein
MADTANGTYQIDALDSSYHSEADCNAAGWYVKWRIYSKTSTSGFNIRDAYGTSGTNIIGVWYSTDSHPVANPYLKGPSGYDTWYQVKFSADGGTTIQTGWMNLDGATGYGISYVESISARDYAFIS